MNKKIDNVKIELVNVKNLGEVHMLIIDECEWFSAIEIAYVLGYKNKVEMCKEMLQDYIFTINTNDINTIDKYSQLHLEAIKIKENNSDQIELVNESGLYDAALRSNNPIAQRFQDWVFENVLPSIFKKGYFDISEN